MFRDDAVYSTAVVKLSRGYVQSALTLVILAIRAIIVIVLTTLCLIEFTHFSDERCIEVENRGKMHFGVPENVRCSKVYVVKCTFY